MVLLYLQFCRQHGQMSQYESYLEFVEMIGKRCGFIVQQDRLRIPSTKNVCDHQAYRLAGFM